MDLKETIKQKKEELQKLVQQYNLAQQSFQQIGQEIVKKQGAIEALEELEKDNKKEK